MPQVRYIEDIYDDYLYDCYIANKRLTPSDWAEYGKEEHHIEIPARDGGKLTPLNSQDLTMYQHWVAGVMQSEVRQKMCFACVPSTALRGWIEELRLKWHRHHLSLKKGMKYNVKPRPPRVRKRRKKERKPRELKPEHLLAKNQPWQEKQVTDNSIRISKILGKKMILITPEGDEITYDSIKLACRTHTLKPSKIREVMQGKRNHYKGFKARYADHL